MAAVGIIGILVLVLIYFVVRSQSLQKQVMQYRNELKRSSSDAKFAMSTLVLLSGELQRVYVDNLQAAQKHGLLSQDDFNKSQFILNHIEYVVLQCCEHRATIEEALTKALERSEYTMKDINQYIAKQPSEIRVPWCKNTLGGFITACQRLSAGKVIKKAEATAEEPEQAQS
ncbi:hypothetical protein [Aestuariibacter salexigens]|uniref:hypothetical protein n=1 Tax=Aestuariibacter salexigens TaxID=226010 RepID=UPI000416F4CE|nr:hypothetical protein [Aestuariibacter salexigens]